MSTRAWRSHLVATLAAALVLCGGWTTPPQASGSALFNALDFYDRGDTWWAIRTLPIRDLTVGELTSQADRWIDAGRPGTTRRRTIVAAAFTLDLIWNTTRTGMSARAFPVDQTGRFAAASDRDLWESMSVALPWATFPVVAWGCDLLSSAGAPLPEERGWWLASVGMLEDTYAWSELVGVPRDRDTSQWRSDSPTSREILEGHLTHARARFPGMPRWRLADAVARAGLDLAPFNDLQRPDVLRDTPPARAAGDVARAERRFEALLDDPSLVGEAELHLGYLELRRRQWSTALAHLSRAREATADTFLLAVDDYFAGWVHEQLGRPADAVAAYRRANALAPGMRNLSTLLAAQLFVIGDRAEAYSVLEAGFKAEQPNFDLLTIFDRGDAHLVAADLVLLRDAIR
jgi:hypothetical protein